MSLHMFETHVPLHYETHPATIHPAVAAESIVKMTGVAINVETRFNENVKPYVYFDLQTKIDGKPVSQPTHGRYDDLSMLKDGETLTIAGTLTNGVLSEGGCDYL